MPPAQPEAAFGSATVDEFLLQLAAKTPTPGGGAVASMVGALACALAQMVVSYSLGKKSLAAHQQALSDAATRLERARVLLVALAEEDARAYGVVNALAKLEHWDPRREELPAAVLASVQAPMAVAAAGCDLLRLFATLEPTSNPALRSDLAIAAVLAEATVQSAGWNVLVNLPSLEGKEDGPIAVATRKELFAYGEQAAQRAAWAKWPVQPIPASPPS